jgi:hypothetical protein
LRQELARNNQEIRFEISEIGDFLDGVRHLPNHQVVFPFKKPNCQSIYCRV